jgi:hypothetical protein
MKKMLLISCVMLTVAATTALAGGLGLNWGPNCASDGLLVNKTFACNVNTGTQAMIVSFAPTADHELCIAVDAYFDGQTSGADWPLWWQFKNAGTCRLTALSLSIPTISGAGVCQDPWALQASGAVTFYGSPGNIVPVIGIRARMKATVSLAAGVASAVTGGTEYTGFAINVSNAKTNPVTTCTGCTTPVAWVLNSLVVSYMDGGINNDEKIETPIVNQCVSWQNGEALCGATPTQNKTWGQVKSLYR